MTLSTPPATCTPAPVTPVFTDAGFTDILPEGLIIADPPLASNTCGGTLTAVAGATSFSLAGANLAPAETCAVTLYVTAVSPGAKPNVIPRSGGAAGVPGFFNDQGAEAAADAEAVLTVVVGIPTLSLPALVVLATLLGLSGAWARRRSADRTPA